MPLGGSSERNIYNMQEDYMRKKRNREYQYLRLRLGILQMIQVPALNLFWLPIVIGTVLLWIKKDMVYSIFDIPKFLLPVCRYMITIITLLIPIIIIYVLLHTIGEFTARGDEAKLYIAFHTNELRNGCPILMSKKHLKDSNVTIREFYSCIPMKTWMDRQEDIADAMNCHFVEKLRYGGRANGKRIVMVTAKGRKLVPRGELYDGEF